MSYNVVKSLNDFYKLARFRALQMQSPEYMDWQRGSL